MLPCEGHGSRHADLVWLAMKQLNQLTVRGVGDNRAPDFENVLCCEKGFKVASRRWDDRAVDDELAGRR